MLRLSPTADGQLNVADFFTPANQEHLAIKDLDFGTAGTLVLPTMPGTAHPHLAVELAKSGTLYVTDLDNMGHVAEPYQSFVVNQVNLPRTDAIGLWGAMSFHDNVLYIHAADDVLKAFRFDPNTQKFDPNPIGTSDLPGVYFPGDSTTVSSNGTDNGIVWDLQTDQFEQGQPAILKAYDASNVGNLLYSSAAQQGDAAGKAVKFTVPIVTAGKVFVPTNGELDIYGLRSQLQPPTAQGLAAADYDGNGVTDTAVFRHRHRPVADRPAERLGSDGRRADLHVRRHRAQGHPDQRRLRRQWGHRHRRLPARHGPVADRPARRLGQHHRLADLRLRRHRADGPAGHGRLRRQRRDRHRRLPAGYRPVAHRPPRRLGQRHRGAGHLVRRDRAGGDPDPRRLRRQRRDRPGGLQPQHGRLDDQPAGQPRATASGSRTYTFGATGLTDIPIPGDFDGNGVTDTAVFRPDTGQWLIGLRDSSGNAIGAMSYSFGATGLTDIPTMAPIAALKALGLGSSQGLMPANPSSPSVSGSGTGTSMASQTAAPSARVGTDDSRNGSSGIGLAAAVATNSRPIGRGSGRRPGCRVGAIVPAPPARLRRSWAIAGSPAATYGAGTCSLDSERAPAVLAHLTAVYPTASGASASRARMVRI